jgi:hypothetical protein
VVGREDEILQATARRLDDLQLFASVGGGEPAALQGGESEVGVVGVGGVNVGHAHGDAVNTVQSHDQFPWRL